MATLVLTVVGTALGGPIGGAIGGLLGSAIDGSVLASPGRREGPRLNDLAVQTSSYGTQIPKVFGTLRVAGTVIWSTDLIESRSTSSGGKGQPSVTTYSYSASFAVLLSGRPIADIGRIWADGNLLRGAAGDFKVSTGFRLLTGDEDQAADPLIASAVGSGLSPANRGCACAVFENLQLASYGNRIPSLTFEVIADTGAVDVGTIAAALAPEVTSVSAQPVGGFAASGGSVGAVLQTLATANGGWFAPAGGQVALRDDRSVDATVDDAGVSMDDKRGPRTRSVAAIESVPRTVTLTYYDPARDYQSGMQQARRPGAGEREQRVEMPAAIDAGAAKTMAAAVLARAETERTMRTLAAGLPALAVAPGDCVAIAGESGGWRVVDTSVEGYVVTLTLAPLAPSTLALAASSGAVVAAPDLTIGTTVVAAFETPALDDSLLTAPRLSVAATGTGPGWRRAALLLSTDAGASWSAVGATAVPATMGVLHAAAPAAPSTLFDLDGAFEVDLGRPDMTLADADDGRLDGGANLALAGNELIQFGRAAPLGGTRWRLTRLLRGRRGTESTAGTQAVGDAFVLLDSDSVRTLDLPVAALGGVTRVLASGAGDAAGPVEGDTAVTGRSVVPPSPVHLTAAIDSSGDATIVWARRSRVGWRWIDSVDAPLGEESEAYRVVVMPTGAPSREVETAVATIVVAAAERAGGPVLVEIRQRGTQGESLPAAITV